MPIIISMQQQSKLRKKCSVQLQSAVYCGRVTPQQKKQMVQALQSQKHTVAMTGDGVNDVLALKEADCSIAMAQGSDAAKNIANVVLLDSNFWSDASYRKSGAKGGQQHTDGRVYVSD